MNYQYSGNTHKVKVNRVETLENLHIPDEGLGPKMVARTTIGANMDNPSRGAIEGIIKARWKIKKNEQYYDGCINLRLLKHVARVKSAY